MIENGGWSALLSRRSFLLGAGAGIGALGLASCANTDDLLRAEALVTYGPMPDEKFAIPAVDISKLDSKYFRRTVPYESKEAAGTIVVDPKNYYVYHVEGDGTATRYGANVGRDGSRWNDVGRKSKWATWTPPKEMIQRQPEAAQYAKGMPGGLDNPLGARTLHLYRDGKCTLYANSNPHTIGHGITTAPMQTNGAPICGRHPGGPLHLLNGSVH